jgi:hypothetical protein
MDNPENTPDFNNRSGIITSPLNVMVEGTAAKLP